MWTESLAQIHELLEVPSIVLATLRRTQDELAVLRSAFATSSASANPCTGHGLHAAILRAAHHPLVEIFTKSISKVIDNGYFPTQLDASTRETLNQDHGEIMGYAEARDQARAGGGSCASASAEWPRDRRRNVVQPLPTAVDQESQGQSA